MSNMTEQEWMDLDPIDRECYRLVLTDISSIKSLLTKIAPSTWSMIEERAARVSAQLRGTNEARPKTD